MLTFRLVTLRWTEPADAGVAVQAATNNAATARTRFKISLPRRIALPR